GVGFGLVPALQSSRPTLTDTMNKAVSGGARGRWIRHALLATEVALALISLTGAGLMIPSFQRLQQVNPGFQPSNLLTAELSVCSVKYNEATQAAEFYERALERVKALPGVESAGAASVLPLTGKDSTQVIAIEGATTSQKITTFQAQYRTVT